MSLRSKLRQVPKGNRPKVFLPRNGHSKRSIKVPDIWGRGKKLVFSGYKAADTYTNMT